MYAAMGMKNIYPYVYLHTHPAIFPRRLWHFAYFAAIKDKRAVTHGWPLREWDRREKLLWVQLHLLGTFGFESTGDDGGPSGRGHAKIGTDT